MTHAVSESSTAGASPSRIREALAGLTPERRLYGRNVSKADVSLLPSRRPADRGQGLRCAAVFRPSHGGAAHGSTRVPGLRAHGIGGGARSVPRPPRSLRIRNRLDRRRPARRPASRFDRPRGVRQARRGARRPARARHRRRRSSPPGRSRGARGGVYVVDFAAAFILGSRPGAIRRRLFERFRAQDDLAAARMRARFTGRPEGDALAEVDPVAVRLWEHGRRIKGLWDRIRRRRD